MSLRLCPETMRRLAAANARIAHNGGVLGMGLDDLDMIVRVDDAAFGRCRDMADVTKRLAAAQKLRLDNVTAAFLPVLGIDPTVLACLATQTSSIKVVDDALPADDWLVAAMTDEAADVVISRDQGVVWRSALRGFVLPRLPDTLLGSLAGRRIGEIVGHPALAELDARVLTAKHVDQGTLLTVTGRRWLLGREIIAMIGRTGTC